MKHFDITLGGVNQVFVETATSEKLKVRLASNEISDLPKIAKVLIDDTGRRIDVNLTRLEELSETISKNALTVFIYLPKSYLKGAELSVNCQKLELADIDAEIFEIDGKVSELIINGGEGNIEINSNLDMLVSVTSHKGNIAINQVSATSKIHLPANYSFTTIKKGIATRLSFEKAGQKAADFSSQGSENIIEFNGIKSELVISQF